MTYVLDIWYFRGKFDAAMVGTGCKYFGGGDLFSLASHSGLHHMNRKLMLLQVNEV